MAAACLLGATSVATFPTRLAIAQSFTGFRPIALTQDVVIPASTRLPLRALAYSKILVAKNETFPLSLTLSTSLRDRQGLIILPEGSRISGELRPINKGSQFFAQKLTIYTDSQSAYDYPLQATSAVITRTEMVTTGSKASQIAKNTLISRAAANLIAEITGDRTLVSEVSQPDHGIGLLAGWFLNGTKAELIAINPNRDLTLTLGANLTLQPSLSHSPQSSQAPLQTPSQTPSQTPLQTLAANR
jgi:hypothetical protein